MNVYTFVLALVITLGAFNLAARRLERRDQARYSEEDTGMIQELHHGLMRLEQRVEALETILLDRTGTPSGDAPRPDNC